MDQILSRHQTVIIRPACIIMCGCIIIISIPALQMHSDTPSFFFFFFFFGNAQEYAKYIINIIDNDCAYTHTCMYVHVRTRMPHTTQQHIICNF